MPFVFSILGGLSLLYFGAEGLVRGSAALALRLRISALVVGLTVVAFGTSAPELVVSLKAAIIRSGDIALGNVIGSNICNIGLILGLSAIIRPLHIQIQTIRVEVPILIGASLMLLIFLSNLRIGRLEGICLAVGIVAFTMFNVWHARKSSEESKDNIVAEILPSPKGRAWKDVVFVLGGLGMLILGANLFVNGSVRAAERMGVGEAFIGLTLVALGTSLPELATSVVAAWKKQNDIAVGNVIGSNIFNILCILGFSSTVYPIQGIGIKPLDLYLMLGLTVLILPLMKSDFTLKRWEGGVLLAVYVCYIVLLVR